MAHKRSRRGRARAFRSRRSASRRRQSSRRASRKRWVGGSLYPLNSYSNQLELPIPETKYLHHPMKGGAFERGYLLLDPVKEVYDQTKFTLGSGLSAFMGSAPPESPSVLSQKI